MFCKYLKTPINADISRGFLPVDTNEKRNSKPAETGDRIIAKEKQKIINRPKR